MLSEKLLEPLEQSLTLSAPMCSTCAFEPYCGADPVFHHATMGDFVGHKAMSAFCQRNMGYSPPSCAGRATTASPVSCSGGGRSDDQAIGQGKANWHDRRLRPDVWRVCGPSDTPGEPSARLPRRREATKPPRAPLYLTRVAGHSGPGPALQLPPELAHMNRATSSASRLTAAGSRAVEEAPPPTTACC